MANRGPQTNPVSITNTVNASGFWFETWLKMKTAKSTFSRYLISVFVISWLTCQFTCLRKNDEPMAQKSQCQSENAEILAQISKGLRSQGQSENDELLALKPRGISEYTSY